MGPPDRLDRVAQFLIALVGFLALANGLVMLVSPLGWYQAMLPTIQLTGPPNHHFLRDIGLAYLSCGALLAYAAVDPRGRWLAAVAGALWLGAHGALHGYEVVAGIGSAAVFWSDAPAVLGPPLVVWIAVGILMVRQRIAPAGVPKRAFLAIVDRMTPDESAYLHEIAAAPGHVLEKFQHFMPATMHRHAAPADLFHTARIGATLVEDCGPCALTAAQGALTDGVARDLINAALASNPPEGELTTAFDFGQAVAGHSADAVTLGDAIEASHGRATRLELAMTAATVRAYPALKRGLGFGKSCGLAPLVVR